MTTSRGHFRDPLQYQLENAELRDLKVIGNGDRDNEEGFVEVLGEMTVADERERILYKIINSPTQLFPKWLEQVEGSEFTDYFMDCSSNGLSEFALMEEEWEVVEELVAALPQPQILKEATLFSLQDNTNISSVILAMDAIDKVFANGIVNNQLLLEPI
ncbi:hypothetical protein EV360DRAFT_76342 [Lentinula raphanica]|nr:hypothetical protein EV360DRAFT_76342 [Lentinula raphanica]